MIRRWVATGRLTLHRSTDPKELPRILIDRSELVQFLEEATPLILERDDDTEESDPGPLPNAFNDEEKTMVKRNWAATALHWVVIAIILLFALVLAVF